MKEGEKYPYEFARQNFRTYEILEVSDMLLSVEQLLNCIVTPFKEYFQLSRKRQKRGCQLVHAADIAESFRSETSFSPDLKGSQCSKVTSCGAPACGLKPTFAQRLLNAY